MLRPASISCCRFLPAGNWTPSKLGSASRLNPLDAERIIPGDMQAWRKLREQLDQRRHSRVYHKTIKGECIRVKTPLSLDDARRIVGQYVEHYNTVRLHSAIGYVTPADKLAGREADIFAQRDRKLAEARERRRQRRQAAAAVTQTPPVCTAGEARA